MIVILTPHLFSLLKLRWRQRRLLRLGIKDIDALSGRDFEHLLVPLFKARGFKVELTPLVGDWGADLILSKDGQTMVVQAKRWKKDVGVKALGDVLRARDKYRADAMLYVATAGYTNQAKQQAAASGIILWDRERFIDELEQMKR